MDMFLFLIGFLAFAVALIWGIISAIKKNGKAKPKFIVVGVGVILMIIGLSMPSNSTSQTASTTTNDEKPKAEKKKVEKKDAPLTLQVDDENEEIKVDYSVNDYSITGQTLKDATVTVNGKNVDLTKHGYFNTKVPVKDGKNEVKVIAEKDNKKKESTLTIEKESKAAYDKRIAAEKQKRKEAEAKAKAEEEAKKKKEEEKKRQAKIEEQKRKEAERKEAAYGNAIRQAENYIGTMSFSKSGLVEQLKFEGYSLEEAKYAVDHIDVNWKEQAALKAQEYLDTMPFSRSGLIEQLKFDGFSDEEATYGVGKAGL